jgi:hypothetical protein
MILEIARPSGASGSALLRMRAAGRAAQNAASAARLTAAVGWLAPPPPRASSRWRRPSSARHPGVEEDVLRRHLVGAVALARVVVDVRGRHGRLLLRHRAAEVGRLIGVGVASLAVDVDGLAGDEHQRSDALAEGQEHPRVRRGVSHAVDDGIGAGAQEFTQVTGDVAVGPGEPDTRFPQLLREAVH